MNRSLASAVLALALCAGSAHAVITSTAASFTPIAPGDVVVYRIGDGSATVLSNAAMPVFVDEYSPTGTLVQTIALPSTAGSGTMLTASGTATSEGLLTVSPDGRYITVTGYNAALGTTSIAASSTSSVTRSIAVLDAFSGTTAYATTSSFSGNNIRSAVSDGANIWATGGSTGVVYTVTGATGAGTIVANSPTNLRQANIFNNQLYVSTGSGATIRLGAVGAGTPNTTGNTIVNLPGFPTAGSPYAFFFADLSSSVAGLDTVYVASDDASAITKYSLVSGSWVSSGVIGVAGDAYRGITGLADNLGNVQLFLTRKGGSAAAGGGDLLSLLDASGYNGAFAGTPTLLASAITSPTTGTFNTAFRGVGIVIPAPGATALLGLGGLLVSRRRR